MLGIGHGAWPQPESAASGVKYWANGDIISSNLKQLMREGGAPRCVFHLAGGSSVGSANASPREDFARTVVSMADLLDWIRLESPETKMVAVSSAAIYGAGHLGPISVDHPRSPVSTYGFHKLMMEQLCQSYAANYGLSVAVVRLFSVYGSGLKKQLLWDICSRLTMGSSQLVLSGTGEELRDWSEIRDVVRLLELAMDYSSDKTPVLNGGTGRATSVREITELVLEAWPMRSSVTFNGESRPGDPFSLVADGQLLQAGFEWRIPVREGVRDYVRWYLEQSRSAL